MGDTHNHDREYRATGRQKTGCDGTAKSATVITHKQDLVRGDTVNTSVL